MKPPDLRSIVLCITFEMSRIRWISTSIGGGAGPLKRSAFVPLEGGDEILDGCVSGSVSMTGYSGV